MRKIYVVTLPSRLGPTAATSSFIESKRVNMNIQEKRNSKGYFTVFTTKEGTKFSQRRT